MPRLPIQQRFGNRVRDLREAAGVSQEDLAWRCRLSRTYLSQLETGRRNPTLAAIEKIAKGLGKPLGELMDL